MFGDIPYRYLFW